MAAKVPAKSILKQPALRKTPTLTDEQKAQTEKDRKNLSIALKHAHLIQHRKDVEAAILNNIAALSDFPAASKYTAKEAIAFITMIKPFQPSDYDSLIEERQVDGKCGYTLCANPPRLVTMGQNAVWKLKKGMADWCSDECAKKGLYVKTQLSEVPAWERVPEQQPDIKLHEDDRPADYESTIRRANRTARVDEWRQKVADNEELARERGEKAGSFRPKQVMADVIVEKKSRPFDPAKFEAGTGSFASIEGYLPKGSSTRQKTSSDSEDGDNDTEGND